MDAAALQALGTAMGNAVVTATQDVDAATILAQNTKAKQFQESCSLSSEVQTVYGEAAPPGEEDESSALSDLQQEHRGNAPPHQGRGQSEGIRKADVPTD